MMDGHSTRPHLSDNMTVAVDMAKLHHGDRCSSDMELWCRTLHQQVRDDLKLSGVDQPVQVVTSTIQPSATSSAIFDDELSIKLPVTKVVATRFLR